MSDEIIRRNSIITAISLIAFCIVSFFTISYYNRKSLESQLVNITNIVNNQIMKTTTEEELFATVDEFTKDQEWLQISISNSLGNIIKDSDNDAIGNSIDASISAKELERIDYDVDTKRVYTSDNRIYFITKINNDIIVRTSVIYEDNLEFIYMSLFIVLILLIAALFTTILLSKKTSKNIIDTFEMIGNHLKTINDGEYEEINCDNKYPEVSSVLKEINGINNSIYTSLLKITHEHDKINFVINNVDQGLIIISDEEEILLLNDYAKKIFNTDNQEYERINYHKLVTNKILIKRIEKAFSNKETSFFDIQSDEKIYSISINYMKNKWFDLNKEVGLFVLVINDVTEERMQDQMKAEFISNASHELKTPITSIRGFAELMKDDDSKYDEKTRKFLSIIYNESVKMKETIDELLYLSNLEYRRNIETEKTKVVFKELIEDIVSSYEDLASKNNVSINIDVNDDLYIIEQVQLLNHLIANLVENAIRYNKQNGKVNITCIDGGKDNIILSVEDTGIGIDEKNIDRVFERFYRVDESRNSGGTGIGLNIVKQVCNILEAKISVESKIDVGTKFTIVFNKSIE